MALAAGKVDDLHALKPPTGLFELANVVGSGTYGDVHKVRTEYVRPSDSLRHNHFSMLTSDTATVWLDSPLTSTPQILTRTAAVLCDQLSLRFRLHYVYWTPCTLEPLPSCSHVTTSLKRPPQQLALAAASEAYIMPPLFPCAILLHVPP